LNRQTLSAVLSRIRQKQPLIHCITNPISINQCANAILAVGGRPMMAEHPLEVAEITQTAQSLLLNLGNITDIRMEAIRVSGQTAAETGIPIVLDAVGIACSRLRRDFLRELLSTVTPTVIKGNYSEIYALYQDGYRATGVDADPTLEITAMDRCAVTLSREKSTMILASGKVDILTDGMRLVHIRNGTAQLSSVTGTSSSTEASSITAEVGCSLR
jgi:hydroxyethylthiazole kinase